MRAVTAGLVICFRAVWLARERIAGHFSRKPQATRGYPYQQKLAESPIESRLISVPTGAAKTAAAFRARLYERWMRRL